MVAIYARVSTSEQNPEAQLLALREYAARRDFCIYKEYVDHVSGDLERRKLKRQNDRAYRELMDDASRRCFDCVLVWKYDRFARSLSILTHGKDSCWIVTQPPWQRQPSPLGAVASLVFERYRGAPELYRV